MKQPAPRAAGHGEASLGPVEILLLDLDETLYPRGAGVLERTDARIDSWLRERHGASAEEASRLRIELWREHGTTLRGLMRRHAIEPAAYLEHVYGVDLSDLIRPDRALRRLLEELPQRKLVFTNAPHAHARNVLALLGVADLFEAVIAIEDFAYASKPHADSYRVAAARAGADPRACCLVDDTHANAVGAVRFGMHAVWVSHGREPEGDLAGIHVVEGLAELAQVVRSPGDPTQA
jgi:putative hydrolase of the HAD superfamily